MRHGGFAAHGKSVSSFLSKNYGGVPIQSAPKISIVMPSYNQGPYLEEAIESVLEQNYSRIELVVIDGGSTDQSLAILEKYDSRIAYWVSEPDRGQSDALNKAFRQITGDIVGWLNSDDSYEPNIFGMVASEFADSAIDLVMCSQFGFIDSKGESRGQKENRFTGHSTLIRYWATDGMTINQPSVFFRRELIRDMEPVVDPRLNYAMDYDLWLRLTLDHRFRLVPGHWANYRYHDCSKTVEDARKFVPEWYSVSQRHWGRRYSVRWWSYWFDHLLHWKLVRPLKILARKLLES